MRSRTAWLLAGFVIAAAVAHRFLRRRGAAFPSSVEPEPDGRAEELRRRIAEARDVVDERETFEAAETPLDEADPDARRKGVHARGRATLDRMRGESEPG